jgi:hypothetical protein
MAQDPLKVDQIQIEPGAAGTRLIDRDPATGAIRIQDSVVTTAVSLSQLAGLRNIANVLIVGASGAGAQYTTIQAAVDVIPANATAANPYIVLVMPGVYAETVNIVRDGVQLIGIGMPTISAPADDHTLIISAQLGTIPLRCLLEGFLITNTYVNRACVRVTGGAASTVGNDALGLQLRDCVLQANAAAGNRPLWATAVGLIEVLGGKLEGVGNGGISLLLIEEVTTLRIRDCDIPVNVSLRYDTGEAEPVLGGVVYEIHNCQNIGSVGSLVPILSFEGQGDGALVVRGSSFAAGRVSVIGDRTAVFENSSLDQLDVQNTSTVTMTNSERASVLAANATAVLDVPRQAGTSAFVAATTAAVAFDVPMSDAAYTVGLEMDAGPANDEAPWVTLKAVTGFTINFATNQTLNVRWMASR